MPQQSQGDPPPFAYSAQRLAATWGVSARHIYDLCASGELGHLRIGSLIRIRQADKEAYEARQWHAPNSAPQTADPSSGDVVSVSAGGRISGGTAFQRGRKSAARSIAVTHEAGGRV
jgi:excisionase family DNA binding protein